ncbi:MAG: heavy-metal-associated domain-containing protein [Ruminococcaceae bacterium]|nr:heavy-metal-associated domain-containing protein [Oscillospiraceae bacterium]MBR3596369.1 cation transporter [Clostridia bacterium]
MKKTFRVEDVDCPNCAAKLEKAIADIDGVKRASISFIAGKMIIEADEADMNGIIAKIPSVAKKALPECTVII